MTTAKRTIEADVADNAPIETKLEVEQCTINHVTIYCDRAEVLRSVVFTAETPGVHVVCVQGLTESTDLNSIRVAGVPGKKTPTILYVQSGTNHKPVVESKQASEKMASAKAQVDSTQAEVNKLKAQLERVRQQNDLVQGYMDAMLIQPKNDTAGEVRTNLDQVVKLLDFHAARAADNDAKRFELQALLQVAEATLADAKAALAAEDMNGRRLRKTVATRDVTIEVSVHSAGEIELQLTYLVSGAQWTPSYDLRVTSPKSATETAAMELTYYGIVKQNTGEDWNGVQVVLSTSSPGSGGTPPLPPTQLVGFKRRSPEVTPLRALRKSRGRRRGSGGYRMERANSSGALELDTYSDDSGSGSESDEERKNVTGINMGAGGSATLEIQRQSTIASNDKEHKVTVAFIPLVPYLCHFTTPALEDKAYLQANTVNSSNYPLLASDRVSVFFDGSFVTTSTLRHTSPGEKIVMFLGVDTSIKVQHRLVTASHGKDGGLFKGKRSSMLFEYHTHVHNTKAVPITITIVCLLPKSNNKFIEVELLQPPASCVKTVDSGTSSDMDRIENQHKRVVRNRITNNVVCTYTLEPQQSQKVPFSYQVAWPQDQGEEIEIL